jgi:hypothetical protein
MIPLLISLGVVSGLEFVIGIGPLWRWRKLLAGGLIMSLSVITGLIIGARLNGWTVLLALLNLYRLVNLLRLIEGRMQADYLYHAVRRTSIWLISLQLILGAAWTVGQQLHYSGLTWWYVLAAGQILVVAWLLRSTMQTKKLAQPAADLANYADRDLPSLTVAIPARNETEDLEACLQSLVGSSYPKLEIIVLDDCSQNKRTPEIIRGFAHDGVRFIAGETPPKQWLAKNYAYAQLAEAANGEVLLFCGVATRFEPDSLKHIVTTMLSQKKVMLSIMPRNVRLAGRNPVGFLLQTNRYLWELAHPLARTRRPPVLSTCWVVQRSFLKDSGGFEAVRHGVLHERYFAKRAAVHEAGYQFLCSDTALGVSCQKQLAEQQATAVRTRYPQLHRRPEFVAAVSLIEFGVLVWPFIIVVVALIVQGWLLAVLAASSFVLSSYLYATVFSLTYRQSLRWGWCLLLPAALYDIGLLNYSLWRYEFQEVIWKDRNVCVPVMQVVPRLPKLH